MPENSGRPYRGFTLVLGFTPHKSKSISLDNSTTSQTRPSRFSKNAHRRHWLRALPADRKEQLDVPQKEPKDAHSRNRTMDLVISDSNSSLYE
jgi:hypothetical protein